MLGLGWRDRAHGGLMGSGKGVLTALAVDLQKKQSACWPFPPTNPVLEIFADAPRGAANATTRAPPPGLARCRHSSRNLGLTTNSRAAQLHQRRPSGRVAGRGGGRTSGEEAAAGRFAWALGPARH
mmetsp:Transcript_60417/g.160956  ORF Transcript_60417/g.160956 Transcript_60417/m.160956 type:complete len:126 (+) Transcript_60417:814-1191(+)